MTHTQPPKRFQVHAEIGGLRISRLEHRIVVHQHDPPRVLSNAEARQLADALHAAARSASEYLLERPNP